MKHCKTLLFIFICQLSAHLYGSDWNNFIINYPKSLFGKGSQTWQIAAYNDNWVYFANKSGVLQFDGNTWNIFPLHNRSDTRSVLPSNQGQRIYVGGINEFGYLEPGEGGRLVYTCMSDSVPIPDRYIGNVWGVHENDHILYFQGDERVLKLLNGKYTIIPSEWKIDCSGMVNGVLYIGTDRGVFVLVGNTFFPLQGAESLESKRIRGIIAHNEGVLIVTAYDGLYYHDGRTTTPFVTGAEDFMRENEVFCAAVSGDQLAVGTVRKGLIVINKETLQTKYFNENNGLQNNTVLSLAFDEWNNLWAGLDSGIDYVCLNSPFTNLYSYPYSYGTGYTALLAGDYLYLGTNRGLYYTPYPVQLSDKQPDIRPVSNSSGQVWNLCRVGEDIFCLHDRGVFLIEGTSMRKVADVSGAWTCQQVMGSPNKMFVGVYNGMYLMEKAGKEWKVAAKIEGLFDSCRFFEQESDQILWIYHADQTLRLELTPALDKVRSMRLYGVNDGFPTDHDVYVSKIDGKIFFVTPQGVYQHNRTTDQMEPCQELNNLLNGVNPYSRLVQHGNHLISLSHREVCIGNLRTYKAGGNTTIVPIELESVELVPGAEALIPLSDSLMVIPNDNGFALLKLPSQSHHRREYKYSMRILRAYLSYPKDSLIYTDNFLKIKPEPKISFHQNAIRFEYGISTFTRGEQVSYQYRLNQGDWSDYTAIRTKEYSNLHEGDYTFEVKAIFLDGTTSADSFVFHILPPWYRSNMAFLFYFLLLATALWGVYRWDDLRLKRKKQQAVVEKDKELHELEKEFEEESARKEQQIVQLEKEKLEYDLRHKSQEMANLMINFVRKSEALTEIKSDLSKVIYNLKGDRAGETKQMLLLVNNKIDANIQSDEVLNRIEKEFDLVHNNFMKHLGEKYPDLSLNDRMMCAYLKMNLSTKEIAPLLNISVRGVETIRYRLRKKFGLERDANLTEFLNAF